MDKKIKEEINKYTKHPDRLIIPACLFIGIGLIINKLASFLMIGLGIGFLILFLNSKKKK